MKMTETVSVSVSGPAFSFLLYENIRSDFDQEGFILGEIIQKETKTITDHDQTQVNISKVIKINSICPCPNTCFFYDGAGRIDRAPIRRLLGGQASKVVAWYKFKRTNSFRFTFREKLVHRQLSEMFRGGPTGEDLFSLCLLITESSDNLSTHTYSQTFLRYNAASNGYDQMPMRIVNLSDPNGTYKSSEPCSDTFDRIVSGLRLDARKTQGLTVITKIQGALWSHIDKVTEELAEAERRMFDLEGEVRKMQEVLRAQVCLGTDGDADGQEVIVNGTETVVGGTEPVSPNAGQTPTTVAAVTPGRKSSVRGRSNRGAGTPRSNKKRSGQSPTKTSPEIETETRCTRKKV